MDHREHYNIWVKELAGTPTADVLASMKEEEIAESFHQFLEFGTAGMRGTLAPGTNRMNEYTVLRATQGVADYVKYYGMQKRGVAIAYDSRNRSAEFAKLTALLLCKNGITVYLYDTLKSVPQLSFAVLELGTFAGVVITASHNPPQYNGYKVYGEDGAQLAPDAAKLVTSYIDEVEDYFHLTPMDEKDAQEQGLLYYIGEKLDEVYYNKVTALVMNEDAIKAQGDKLSIVYTPLHGTGNVPVRELFSRMGLKNVYVVEQQVEPDGNFPTVKAPNPEEKDCFDLAIKLADAKGATFIIATDPDCDRMGVAAKDGAGNYSILTGNQIGCLMMDYILSCKKDDFEGDEFVVKSIVSTTMADAIAAHYGVQMRDVLTGFRFIGEQIKLAKESGEGNYLFGFEESYGFLAGKFVRDKDAAMSSMIFAEMACAYAQKDMTIFDALNQMYKKYGYYMEKGISLTLEGIEGIEKIKGAVSSLRANPPGNIGRNKVLRASDFSAGTCTDNVSGEVSELTLPKADMLIYEMEHGRLIFRPSGTEPKLKAYCLAMSKDAREADIFLTELEADTNRLMAQLTK